MELYELSAYVFTALSAIVIVFHVALVAGAPWGAATLGGRYKGKLPTIGRIISTGSIAVLVLFIVAVLHHARLLSVPILDGMDWPVWMVFGYSVLGVIMHLATPSNIERWLWLPVLVLMMLCSGIVAWMI